MCGIYGGIAIKNPAETLKRMGGILARRGPDALGSYIKAPAALGHRRLSIIDLASGDQPIFSSDKKQVIVYNGEIYNFKELRKDLESKGHVFRTNSDTEVILNSYRQWGYDCLSRFNGMFAFALWDEFSNKLWLARDRLGKKPLYFMRTGSSFYFASEGKALWNLPEYKGGYDLRSIDQYLTYRYVPGERSFYEGIEKLPPGHWMEVDGQSAYMRVVRWWDMPETRRPYEGSEKPSADSYRDEFRSLFSSAVKMRLVSDVPVGLFLSSGVDSSSIAFEMAKVSRPTFITIGFGEDTDELEGASLLSRSLGANHYPFLMKKDDFSLLPQAVASMDEPYGDPIILPTYLLARNAAGRVKVILTGDGADEALGGYIHHAYFGRMPQWIPPFAFRSVSALIRLVPPGMLDILFDYPASMGRSGKTRMVNLLRSYPDVLKSYREFAAVFTEGDKSMLYAADFKKALATEPDELESEMRAHFRRDDLSPLDRAMRWDMRSWFPNQTLMKLDRLTMANSIEGRCPYADYRIVELLAKLPLSIFKDWSRNKDIIRGIYGKEMPFMPRKKQAFYLPMHNIFKDQVVEFISGVVSRKTLADKGWFNTGYVDTLLRERGQSPLLSDKKIMSLVILTLWLESSRKPPLQEA